MFLDDKKVTSKLFRFFLYVFSLLGFIFFLVFFAMQFNLLNVKGSISERNLYFNVIKNFKNDKSNDLKIICRINILSKYAPFTAVNIYKTMSNGARYSLLDKMIDVASNRFNHDDLFISSMENCYNSNDESLSLKMSAFNWADTDEWNLLKEVFIRDQELINRAAKDAGISPRLILGGVIGEQLRFFNSRRESFKGYFEPLKILASLSKISFGIAGLKPKTATLIEEHLKDRNSPFYLGQELENVLDYKIDSDVESERMDRITNTDNPYYSYLYVGLFLRQVEAQWGRAGYDISQRPEILSTLYNLGFNRSIPKPNPMAGGAIISINGVDYTFGDLGYEFYYSGELSSVYPLN